MEKENKHPAIVGIRFSPIGKNYFFDASKFEKLKVGDYLVVETSRGWQMGEMTQFVDKGKIDKNMHYKPVNRIASEADLKKKTYLDDRANEALGFTKEKVKNKKIKDVKMISAELSFDENLLTFLYTTENDNHVTFGPVIKEIKDEFNLRKVDFHKIGPRDVAKYYCGMGACGLEVRCCSQFIKKFEPISIRMAKTQGISLTPSDITGMCDRLRCCLGYEYCTYVEALKGMPKRKKKVKTPFGIGVVKDLAPIRRSVLVSIPEHGVKEFGLDEIEMVSSEQNPENSKVKEQNRSQNNNQKNKKNRSNNHRRRQRPNKPPKNG